MSPQNPIHPASALMSRRAMLRLLGVGGAAAVAAPVLAACSSSGGSGSTPTSSAPGTAAAGSGSAASTATSGGALPSVSPTKFTIQLPWINDVESGAFFVADQHGYFKQAGITIKFQPGGSDIGSIEGIVAGGQADIGISTDVTTVFAAIADGNPLVCIGSLYQYNLNTLMSNPDNPFTTIESMKGKKLGGPQGMQTKFDAMFTIAGLSKDDYKFVPTGYGPDPLINGDVDVLAGFLTDEVLSYKQETGKDCVTLDYAKAGLPAYTLPLYVTTDTLKNKRDALKAMLAALLKGYDEDIADPSLAAPMSANIYGKGNDLTVDGELAKNKAYLQYAQNDDTKAHGLLWMDEAQIAGPIFAGMKASGLKTPSDAASVLDMSLLDELHSGS